VFGVLLYYARVEKINRKEMVIKIHFLKDDSEKILLTRRTMEGEATFTGPCVRKCPQ